METQKRKLPATETPGNGSGQRKGQRRYLRLFRLRLIWLFALTALVAVSCLKIQNAKRNYEALQILEDEPCVAYKMSQPTWLSRILPAFAKDAFGGLLFQDVAQIKNYQLEGCDSNVFFRATGQFSSLKSFECSFGDLRKRHFVEIAKNEELETLVLHGVTIASGSFQQISEFPRLQYLEVWGLGEMEGVFTASRFPRLDTLALEGIALSEETFAQISQLELCSLRIVDSELAQGSLKALGSMSSIEEMSLASIQITDEDCAQLAKLQQLRELDLAGSNVSDRGVEILCRSLTGLRSLDLKYCEHISDASADSLLQLTNLEEVTLARTSLSSAAITKLGLSLNLKKLHISSSQNSPELGGLVPAISLYD
ncbi:MAG: hypothetical protein AAF483_11180 [Planctomycetota bacterium]